MPVSFFFFFFFFPSPTNRHNLLSGLDVACEREVEGDLVHRDMGEGMCFRPGMFDGAIRYAPTAAIDQHHTLSHTVYLPSVSALQWLCNQDKRAHNPRARMQKFFTTLYACMV